MCVDKPLATSTIPAARSHGARGTNELQCLHVCDKLNNVPINHIFLLVFQWNNCRSSHHDDCFRAFPRLSLHSNLPITHSVTRFPPTVSVNTTPSHRFPPHRVSTLSSGGARDNEIKFLKSCGQDSPSCSHQVD